MQPPESNFTQQVSRLLVKLSRDLTTVHLNEVDALREENSLLCSEVSRLREMVGMQQPTELTVQEPCKCSGGSRKVARISSDITTDEVSLDDPVMDGMQEVPLTGITEKPRPSIKALPHNGYSRCSTKTGSDSEDTGVVVQVPAALRNRWQHQQQKAPGLEASTSRGRSLAQFDASLVQKKDTMVGALELDSRWRDLYAANDAENEEDAIMRQLQNEKTSTTKRNARPRFSGSSLLHKHHTSKWFESVSYYRTHVPIHPFGYKRLLWDLLGMVFMLYDACMVPISFAFKLETSTPNNWGFPMFILTCAYWTIDLFVTFNTGYADGSASIELSRKRVAIHYIRTFFFFDCFILVLDYLFIALSSPSFSQHFKPFRILRTLRLMRLMKLSKIGSIMEDIFTSLGVQWLILVVAIFKTLAVIVALAHLLSCMWFFLGQHSWESNEPGWLDLIPNWQELSVMELYSRSVYWVLGHLTAAPVDSTISPQNGLERSFTVMTIMSSLLVIGSGISRMSNTMNELNRMNQEASDAKRQLLRYLRAAGVRRELSQRVIRFALHSHKRKCAMNLDSSVISLLSETLTKELTMCQRSQFLTVHPFFSFIQDTQTSVFLKVCYVFDAHVYADDDIVFAEGTLSEQLYITLHGTYKLTQSKSRFSNLMWASHSELTRLEQIDNVKHFDQPQWFCEVSLYTKAVHHSTLAAVTFADAFTLSGEDLAECVRQSPGCIANVYRYAQEYLGILWDGPDAPPPGKLLVDDYLPARLAERATEAVRNIHMDLDYTLDSPMADDEALEEFLVSVRRPEMPNQDMEDILLRAFGELNEESGIYVKVKQFDERKRSLSAMLSVYWMVTDNYDAFTAGQKTSNRMSKELWAEWQRFIQWADMDNETLHAMMVFLAIRGLGKVKSFAKALPPDSRSPEKVVLRLIEQVPGVVPSVQNLSEEKINLMTKAFMTHETFNLAQMLQGENTPSQVSALQDFVQEEGEELLKFYLVGLVGVMCAIRGAETLSGSLFMDQKNGSNVLLGIQCLRKLSEASPHAIYWGFIASRAQQLGLPTRSPEQLAMARFASLVRATPADREMIQSIWCSLGHYERIALTNHFLADGICEFAVLFTFLPLYLEKSKQNNCVTMRRALIVLIELLETLKAEDYGQQTGENIIYVDLSDLAAFARDVKSPRVFTGLTAYCKLMRNGSRVQVFVSTQYWHRVNQTSWQEDSMQELAANIRRSDRRLATLETQMMKICPPSSEIVFM